MTAKQFALSITCGCSHHGAEVHSAVILKDDEIVRTLYDSDVARHDGGFGGEFGWYLYVLKAFQDYLVDQVIE